MKPETPDAVRERERERELHFSNRSEVLFGKLTDTSNYIDQTILGRNTFICDIYDRLFI